MKKSNLLMLFSLVVLLSGCGNKPEPTGEHKFLTGWDKDETYHWHYCEEPGCEEKSSKAKHTFEWAVTKEASYEANGVRSYRCKTCGYVKEKEEITKLTHTYNTGSWEHDTLHHWHACADEGYDDKVFGIDAEAHTIVGGTAEVEPTYEEVGHTASGTCSVCGANIGSLEIPVLNETNYVKEITKQNNILTETWTLKDADVIGRDKYVVTKNIDYGWVVIDDHSGKDIVTTNYNYYEFNKAFPGIKMSISGKTVTINVTKEGGYTFDNKSIIFPTSTKNTVSGVTYVITGEPLTINAPEGLEEPGLLMSCSTTPNYMSTLVVDNNLTINYSSGYTKASKGRGLSESKLTINKGAKLTIKGFYNGIYASYQPITVNGALDVTASNLAIISSSTSKNREIKIAEGSTIYFDEVAQASATTIYSDDIKNSSVKHLEVVPA